MRPRLVLLLALPMILLLAAWAPLRTGLPTWLAGLALPGLTIEGLSPGIRHISADRITYADSQGVWLVVERPELHLSGRALFRGRVTATRLTAAEIRVERWPVSGPDTQQTPSSGGFALPQLPVAVEIQEIALPRIVLPEASLALTGRAKLDDAGLDAAIQAHELEGEARANVEARFDGTQLVARIEADDPQGRLAGAPVSARLTLDGPVEGAAFTLEARYDATSASLTGTVRREAAATELEATGPVEGAAFLPENLRPLVAGSRIAVRLRHEDAGTLTLFPSTVEAAFGTVRVEGRALPELDLAVSLALAGSDRFAGLVPQGIAFTALAADARVSGPTSRPLVEGTAVPQGLATGVEAADTLLGPTPRLAFRVTPDLAGTRLEVAGAALTALVEGDLGETLDARGEARVSAIPGGVEGEALLRFTARGPRTDPAVSLNLEAPRLAVTGVTARDLAISAEIANALSAPTGTVRGGGVVLDLPLRLDIAARPENGAVRLERGRVEFGPAVLEASGLLDPAAPRGVGNARLTVADLRPFSALAGQQLGGRVNASAEGDSAGTWRLVLEAPTLSLAGQSGNARLALDGRADRAEVSFEARGPAARITLAGTTRLALPLEAEVRRFTLAAVGESLNLVSPLRLRYDGQDAVLENIALATGQGGRLTGNLAVRGPEQNLSGQLRFTGLPLGLARAALPDTPLRGTLAGEMSVSGTVAVPAAELTLRGTGLGVNTPELRSLPPATLTADARLRGTAVEGRATLAAGTATRLEARFSLPDPQRISATVTGEADVGVLTQPFLAGGADRLRGRVALRAQAEGPLASPSLSGGVDFLGLSYANPDTGMRVTDLRGRAVFQDDRLVFQNVAGRTPGGGTVSLAGSVAPLEPTIPVDLRLTARGAAFASPDYGRVNFDADLTLTGAVRGGAQLGGRLLITGGELRVPDRLPRAVTVLVPFRETGRTPPGRVAQRPPPVRRTAAQQRPEPAFSLALNVTIEAPERLFLRGRGLETELVGRLQLLGTLANPEIRGELRGRRGTFAVVGRTLTVSRAILRFNQGSILPTLDVLATVRTANYTVGVGFTGPANEPQVVLESQPPLPQDEILARLLFDRGTNRLSPFEIIRISEALAQMTGVELPGGGTEGALAGIRRFLGLDQLGVGGPGGGAQAGRYLLPGVYLGLRQGTDGQTGVGIEAEVTDRLKIEGSTGTAGERLGATYQFEW
ncbi:translocation/assembly module TamB domain-containing protein [Sabulicella rubraurantiaca]|uniref:translocation/assembly module TamB domain-containing protein n=1 Tax=Sabulicella rubraurantiaca TaxID=2811429 RepID=UPI001A975255|nr:translocation/assembly module TamB domain-containing protein [Sabulicella rubraurantiaca]